MQVHLELPMATLTSTATAAANTESFKSKFESDLQITIPQ